MNDVIVLLGCTASGKSDLAEALARRLSGSLLVCDSMQVYRGMDIGTAKPPRDIQAQIPHHMLDLVDPWETYSAARFAAEARPMLEAPRDRPIIIVAGTILYLRALMEGLFEGPSADPALRAQLQDEATRLGTPALHAQLAAVDPLAASRIHSNDLRRIIRALEVHRLTGTPISELQTQWNRDHPAIPGRYLGIRREKDDLNRRINLRVKAMLAAGLVDEVRRLRDHPRGLSPEAANAVGYRQLLDHFAGRCSLDDAIEQIKIQTRHLAKLQRTWLKRFTETHWLDASEGTSTATLLAAALKKGSDPISP